MNFEDVGAEFVSVVDRVDDHGLERVFAFADLGAGRQQVLPALDRDLEYLQCIQARFSGEEQRVFRM